MQHLAAFNANVALTSVNQDLSLVSDPWVSYADTIRALLPMPCRLQQTYLTGVGLDKARLIVPSLKVITYPRIPRYDTAANPPDLPAFVNFGDNPPAIQQSEGWNFQVDNSNAGAQRISALAWLVDRMDSVPSGLSYVMEGTGAITGSAYVWNQGAITFEDQYPPKRFAIIGIRVVGANGIGARLIIPNYAMRPGTIMTANEATDDFLTVWNGSMGKLGEFTPPLMPQLEIFPSAAGTTQRVYIQVVPMS